jgi:hypothetical protein
MRCRRQRERDGVACTLKLVIGHGDLEQLDTKLVVTESEKLQFQWTTDQAAAKHGRWRVVDAAAPGTEVASGKTIPAPAVGHLARFLIPASGFLLSTSPVTPKVFQITITPHGATNKALGSSSNVVTVTQHAPGVHKPPDFGGTAAFPWVDIISFVEKFGVVPLTQIHFATAELTLRIENKTAERTEKMLLTVADERVLMRQVGPGAAIKALEPGQVVQAKLALNAELPPPTSQLPEDQQYTKWNARYRNSCGVDLRATLHWRGDPKKAPMADRRSILLGPVGWSEYATVPAGSPIFKGKDGINVCKMSRTIRAALDGHVVGYSFFVGKYPRFESGGKARTIANALEVPFTSRTKITVASVSKLITAIAAVRMLDARNLSLTTTIGPYLPTDWACDPFVSSLTFQQLLSQSSGIKHFGNVPQTYATLRTLFTQAIPLGVTTTCQGSSVKSVTNPINPNDTSRCYSNFNFAIMRILLPRLAGFAEDPNVLTRPKTLAKQYVSLVQQNVFNLVGQLNVSCAPPEASSIGGLHALAYKFPGDELGMDWGDESLGAGGEGWYLSIEDIAKVLLSIHAKDGKIFPTKGGKDLLQTMRQLDLGWDKSTNTELEKNGAFGSNGRSISTSAAIHGPVGGPSIVAALFLNSDIVGGPNSGASARKVLDSAFANSLVTLP